MLHAVEGESATKSSHLPGTFPASNSHAAWAKELPVSAVPAIAVCVRPGERVRSPRVQLLLGEMGVSVMVAREVDRLATIQRPADLVAIFRDVDVHGHSVVAVENRRVPPRGAGARV